MSDHVTGNLVEWGNGDLTLGGTTLITGDVTGDDAGVVTKAATATVTGTITANP
jgi:hypothetical protein